MNIHRVAIVLFVLMTGTLAYAVFNLDIPGSFNVVTPAAVTSNPASLSFGDIVQGGFATQTFTLTNNGGATATNIVCTWIWTGTAPTGITVDPINCPASLSPAVSATVSVTIRVGSTVPAEPYSGKVNVTGN